MTKNLKEAQHPSPELEPSTGIVSAHPKGFGFVTTASDAECFLTPAQMRQLVPGDEISFEMEPGAKPGQWQAQRLRLVNRAASVWQGTVVAENGQWRLETDSPCFVPLILEDTGFVAPGMVVSVRVVPEKTLTSQVKTRLERVLGERERKGFELDYALAKFDFPVLFSKEAGQQAERAADGALALGLLKPQRADERALAYVTIDGEATRDFDDAVLVRQTESGFDVWVAIADVSHYVKPGSALDKEAARRGTSVYLPGRTVPMLPEALSNGLCSLVPGEERLTVTAHLRLDAEGQILEKKAYRSVIRSAARLTYKQVAEYLAGNAERVPAIPAVQESLRDMAALYALLSQQRKERGVLDFDDAEPKLVAREDGEFEMGWEYRTVAHKIVEELMLLANRGVASLLSQSYGPALFRHQPLPLQEDWDSLREWVALQGEALPEAPSLKALSELLLRVAASKQNTGAFDLRVRQVMQQALYDPSEPSHFSLGFYDYTHFTSPIRRYADLWVHRLLLSKPSPGVAESDVPKRCSERSRAARLAERFVWDRLKKRILARDVAKTTVLDAKVVAAPGRRGARVVIDAWQTAAFLSAECLMDEGYLFDGEKQAWACASGPLELGTRLKVRWTHLTDEKGRVELYVELA